MVAALATTSEHERRITIEPAFTSDAAPTEWSLARTLSEPLLAHDTALATISHLFGGSCAPELLERIDDASRPLFGVADACLPRQADALADVIANRLGLQVGAGGWRTLLLGDALEDRDGHPLLLATLGHELARRAGLSSVVARSDEDCCCVLIAGEMALPVCFGAVPDGLDVSALRSCCPHELAFTVLTAIGRQAPASPAAAARRVRNALPIDWDLTRWSLPADL